MTTIDGVCIGVGLEMEKETEENGECERKKGIFFSEINSLGTKGVHRSNPIRTGLDRGPNKREVMDRGPD